MTSNINLALNTSLAHTYKSKSQIARVLTEHWVKTNSYCPACGKSHLQEFTNNKPVADFYCQHCDGEYELKAKQGKSMGKKIIDGAYAKMIERINAENNPSFFFLTYDNIKWEVTNFLIIPKHYFIADMIEKRPPLSPNARRAGWVGCNINLAKVPDNGRIYLIKNAVIIAQKKVQEKWQRTEFLKAKKGLQKGWILDLMNCVDAIPNQEFSLQELYKFEQDLALKYPTNHFIKDKIRQQLQLLRDKGLIEFTSRGKYKKLTL